MYCVWVAVEVYSVFLIVLIFYIYDGMYVFDDFREVYVWLSYNIDMDDKVSMVGCFFFDV